MPTNNQIAYDITLGTIWNDADDCNQIRQAITEALDAKDAQAAVLRQGLSKSPHIQNCQLLYSEEDCICGHREALASTTAGKELLERMEKLEALYSICERDRHLLDYYAWSAGILRVFDEAKEALQALDEGGSE